jgi:RHH-type rel operon transcriptional repressor/antitoxin RelB
MNQIIALSAEMEERLARLAQRTERSREDLLSRMILDGLSEIEADLAADDIENRVSSGAERVFSSQDVRRRLGLDD